MGKSDKASDRAIRRDFLRKLIEIRRKQLDRRKGRR